MQDGIEIRKQMNMLQVQIMFLIQIVKILVIQIMLMNLELS